jgi:hypothetical protein
MVGDKACGLIGSAVGRGSAAATEAAIHSTIKHCIRAFIAGSIAREGGYLYN